MTVQSDKLLSCLGHSLWPGCVVFSGPELGALINTIMSGPAGVDCPEGWQRRNGTFFDADDVGPVGHVMYSQESSSYNRAT